MNNQIFLQSLCGSRKLNLCQVPAMQGKVFGSKLALKQNLTGSENSE